MISNNIEIRKNNPAYEYRIFMNKYGTPCLFLAPFLLLFVFFYGIPVITAMGYSLTRYNIIQPSKFVGIMNYTRLFTDDEIFLKALGNTLVFSIIAGPLSFIISYYNSFTFVCKY